MLPAEEYPYTVTLQSPHLWTTQGTHAQIQKSLFQVFPDRTLEGRGKTEKQQHSPEATAALQLDRSLQYSSKIRFKLKKKTEKSSGVEGLGDLEAQSRAGRQTPSSLLLWQGHTQNIYFLTCFLPKQCTNHTKHKRDPGRKDCLPALRSAGARHGEELMGVGSGAGAGHIPSTGLDGSVV